MYVRAEYYYPVFLFVPSSFGKLNIKNQMIINLMFLKVCNILVLIYRNKILNSFGFIHSYIKLTHMLRLKNF